MSDRRDIVEWLREQPTRAMMMCMTDANRARLLEVAQTIADLRTEIESLNHFLDVSRSLARCRLEEIDRLKAEKETP